MPPPPTPHAVATPAARNQMNAPALNDTICELLLYCAVNLDLYKMGFAVADTYMSFHKRG